MQADKTDDMIMLQGTKMPLSSMSLIGNIGSTGSGKTYQMLKIQTEYEKVAKQKYLFSNPDDVLYAPFTDVFYISSTRVQTPDHYQFIASSEIFNLFNKVIKMKDDYSIAARCQRVISNITGDENPEELKVLIQLIETSKMLYPQLLQKCENSVVKEVYKLLGYHYNGYFLRKPKVSILLDDLSGEKYLSGVNNQLYQFLTRRRHYYVYNMIVNVHSITILFGQLREVFSCYLLFRDINQEHLYNLYKQTLGMQRKDFNVDDFISIYKSHGDYEVSIYSGDNSKQHNFLYVMRQPEKHIYLNFDKKVF